MTWIVEYMCEIQILYLMYCMSVVLVFHTVQLHNFFLKENFTLLDLLCNEIIFILAEAEERKRRRKSRWQGDEKDKTFIPGMPTVLPSNMSKDQEEAYLRKSP